MIDHALMTDLRFIESLLGRPPVMVGASSKKFYSGKTILVTGGGGSIGSYLCKVLVECGVKTLIILERNEYNLYFSYHLLPKDKIRIVPLLGDVLDTIRLKTIFTTFKVDLVFHAAAYKHVPLVERNVYEGLKNNVFGTLHLVMAAKKAKVPLLMVSSDKAVNPTSMMGVSKKMAESIVLEEEGRVVRFGNVLWSSGSVLPLFKYQLEHSIPVTLTDMNVTRYFMSVREAVVLILKAGMIQSSGVYIFDMEEPVRIRDMIDRLAEQLKITKYEIELIGLRTGEKLYEELALGKGLVKTKYSKIRQAKGEDCILIGPILKDLAGFMERNDLTAIKKLIDSMNIGYMSDGGIVDELWLEMYVNDVDTIYGEPQSYLWNIVKKQ